MSEVTDLVVPILQKVQADLAEVKRVQAEHGGKLEDLEIHLAYLTGRESQNTFDLNKLRQRVKAAEERITLIEPRT